MNRPAFGLHHELNVERGNAPMKTKHVPISRDRGTYRGAGAPTSGALVRALRVCLAFVAALTLMVVVAPVASAAPLQVVGVSGSDGTGNGQFRGTGGVAVRESNGDVYTVDVGGQRIQRFNAAGEFQDAFGTPGSGDGQFDFSPPDMPEYIINKTPQIAIDQSDGSVYVADVGNDRVQKFSAAGTYQSQFGTEGAGNGEFSRPQGVAVDPTDQSVYVGDTGNFRVQKFSAAGAYQSQFGSQGDGDGQFNEFGGPARVGVDSAGQVYVLDVNNRVLRFDATGIYDPAFAPIDASFPYDLAVDSAGDHVFIGNYFNTITEVDASGATVDHHGTDASIPARSITGIGLRAGALTHALGLDGYDGSLQTRLYRFGAAPTPATLTLSPVTDLAGRSATVNASINPNGAPAVGYQVEFSTDGATFTTQPATPVNVGDGSTAVPVSYTITGLDPNQFYLYRFVVKRPYNADVYGDFDFLSTLTVAPTVTETGATPTEVSARLRAKINPESIATTYHFEYGLTDTYGSTFPATPVDIGDGRAPVAVVKAIAGLDAGTSYHYRVVAENAAGVTNGPDRTFTTRTPTLPGDATSSNGRAFEQVSPANKNGFAVSQGTNVQSTEAGDAVAFASDGAFPGATTGVVSGRYIARRGGADWATRSIEAPQQAIPSNQLGLGGTTFYLSPDLSSALQYSARALAPGAIDGGTNIYRTDTVSGARSLVVAAQQPSSVGALQTSNFYAGGNQYRKDANADLSTLAMQAQSATIVPDAFGGLNLYEFAGGQTRLVNRFDDGAPMSNGNNGGLDGVFAEPHSVSADGRRIFFSGQARALQNDFADALYMRIDGAITKPISVSQVPGASDVPQPVRFFGATADGSVAYFSSVSRLTVDAPTPGPGLVALYRYDVEHDALTLVRSNVLPSYGAMAADGSRVYFVDRVGDASDAHRVRIVTWDGSTMRVVATAAENALAGLPRKLSASADGRFVVFQTDVKLEGFADPGEGQVYVYDADTNETSCASCAEVAEESRRAFLWGARGSTAPVSNHAPREALDDGRVFFTTNTALVPEDVNGKDDVYEWRDGVAALVSSGTGAYDALFHEASADGRDVFFSTVARLVPQDTDNVADLYDARLGGGLPTQHLVPARTSPPCADDDCQGAPSITSASAIAGSVTFAGGADAASPVRPRSGSVKVSSVKTVTGSFAKLRVTVPAAGSVGITGSAIRSVSRRVSRAGTVSVQIVLSASARRTLSKKGSIKARIRVAFRPTDGRALSKSLTVTFKQRPVKKRKSIASATKSPETGRG
jgi:hypothetical protein